ncbi:Xyloglucanase precursor [Flavobacterium columnare]|uniref:T9SS C-terminal target domain-containing protein n=3 Tax=Flavobacterium TaxID=237 RepID=A0A2N9PD21_9FLAO|nr:T9SS type A sorting domain-containing protein [Flavobacterium columnare]RVU90375.1 T9SS C-terminal target domain-containing protein [Flavobacterium columnare]SPE78266.1 Xyloglucanase precursor [Flavobacterium columnare]
MKTYLIAALLFFNFNFYSQSFVFDQKMYKSIEDKTIKFDEINKRVEESFKNRIIDAKGSGWKVYQRWKYMASFEVDENGYLPNSIAIDKMKTEFKESPSFNDKIYRKSLNNLWAPAGPFTYTNKGSWSTGQGRVNCSVTDPNNEDIIYIGAAAGGVWKSTDGGLNWSPKTDFIDSIGISGLAIDPNNTNVIYAITGDADGADTVFDGLYKSNDGGDTWIKMGLTDVNYGRTILIDPNNSNVVIVGTNSGVYRSEDGGLSFELTSDSDVIYQLAFHPTNSNIVYASNSTGGDTFIYKSVDNGVNWEMKKSFVRVKKMLMATTKADPNYLYLLGANTSGDLNGFKGVYLSVDAGENFTLKNDRTDILESYQSYYDLALAVSQTNKDLIYTGCLNMWGSKDGGITFTKLNHWSNISDPRYTHADIHNIRTVGSDVYVSSDGGIYISKDAGNTFVNRTSGLQISQFYKMDTSPLTNSRLVGGLQDNGGYVSDNDVWSNFYGGDGMDTAINPVKPHLAYGFTQYGGNLYEYNFNSKYDGSFIANHSYEKGEWVTPLEISNRGNIYGGWKEIEELVNRTWKPITNNSNGYNIKNMKVNPLYPNRLLYYRKSKANANFDELIYTEEERDNLGNLVPKVITLPSTSRLVKNLAAICFNPVNPAIFYILYAGKIYKTADSGKTWNDISFNLPYSTTYCIAAQGNQKNSVYVGTNLGVYYFDEESNSWSLFNNGLPRVKVTELKINTSENNLTASTYGRGIWRVALPSGTLAVEEQVLNEYKGGVFPNPSNGVFKINVSIEEPLKMAIYDVSGKMIFEKSFQSLSPNDEINISNNPKGIYLLDIKSDQYTIRKKILIK